MIFGGFERTVPAIDVAHYKDESVIVQTNDTTEQKETQNYEGNEEEDWSKAQDLPADWKLTNNRDLRPKLHDKIEFSVQGCLKDGVVTKVGKKSGKDKNRCWIEDDHNENSYDFVREVNHWRKTGTTKSVTFEGNPRKLSSAAIKD